MNKKMPAQNEARPAKPLEQEKFEI